MRRLRAGVTLLYSQRSNYYFLYLKYVDGETTNHIRTIYSDSFKLRHGVSLLSINGLV